MTANIKREDLDVKELEAILDRALEGTLDEEGYRKLKAALETLGYLTNLIGDKDTTISRLRKLLFGPGSEKADVFWRPCSQRPILPKQRTRMAPIRRKRRNQRDTAATEPGPTPGQKR